MCLHWLCALHYAVQWQVCGRFLAQHNKSQISPEATRDWNYTQLQCRAQKTQGWLVTFRNQSLRWEIRERTLLFKRRMNSCYWWGWPEGRGRGKGLNQANRVPLETHTLMWTRLECVCVSPYRTRLKSGGKTNGSEWLRLAVEVKTERQRGRERIQRFIPLQWLQFNKSWIVIKLCRAAVLKLLAVRHFF